MIRNPYGLPYHRPGLCTCTKPFGTSYIWDFAQGKTLRKAPVVSGNPITKEPIIHNYGNRKNVINRKTPLRIKAERLGTVSEVTTLLQDLESAYNSIYAFDFIVNTLVNDRNRKLKKADERFHRLRRYWKEFSNRKDYPFDPFMYEMFFEEYSFAGFKDSLPNLLEFQTKIEIEKIILPSDRLIVSKVNIQSPGFWEVLGSLNPLQQIREYLKDRHERKKDEKYRSKQEEELGLLEIQERKDRIITQRIETLRNLGYSEAEIRQLVTAMVIQPLNKLGKHQDNGQIEGPDE